MNTCKYIDRYLKIRQMDKSEIKPLDMLNMLMDMYVIPKEHEIESFIDDAKTFLPNQREQIGRYKKDYVRMSKLKSIINDITNSPIISYRPLVIDLGKYRTRKDVSQNFFLEKGKYVVKSVLCDMVVLEREKSEGESIRISLKRDVNKYVKKGDVVELLITRKLFMVYWDVVKVYKCIPKSMV